MILLIKYLGKMDLTTKVTKNARTGWTVKTTVLNHNNSDWQIVTCKFADDKIVTKLIEGKKYDKRFATKGDPQTLHKEKRKATRKGVEEVHSYVLIYTFLNEKK